MMFHGPIRSQAGMNPLYNAITPSVRTVCRAQCIVPSYSFVADVVVVVAHPFIEATRTRFWFISRVLITSSGVEATALPRLAMKLDLQLIGDKQHLFYLFPMANCDCYLKISRSMFANPVR